MGALSNLIGDTISHYRIAEKLGVAEWASFTARWTLCSADG